LKRPLRKSQNRLLSRSPSKKPKRAPISKSGKLKPRNRKPALPRSRKKSSTGHSKTDCQLDNSELEIRTRHAIKCRVFSRTASFIPPEGTSMKKLLAIWVLLFSVLACGGQSPQQIAEQTATAASVTSAAATARIVAMTSTAAAWTKTPTPTPDFNASISFMGANIYAGPGENYEIIDFTLSDMTILGQAYGCTWFKIVTGDGLTMGWVKADDLIYSVKCSDVDIVDIPPTPLPTATHTPHPTKTNTPRPQPINTLPPPPTPLPPCELSSIEIQNDTGAAMSLILSGPYSYSFWLGTCTTNISVCPGSYDYTAYGCGSSATGTMSSGGSHRFWCE
jgi:hypothetical protein